MTAEDSERVLSPADAATAQLAVTLVTAAREGYREMRLAWNQAMVASQNPDDPLHAADIVDVVWWCTRLTNLALQSWQDDRPDREGLAAEWLQGAALGLELSTKTD